MGKAEKYAKQTRNAARINVIQNQVALNRQSRVMRADYEAQLGERIAMAQVQGQAAAQHRAPAPGWYPDPRGNGGQAWWDGRQWQLPQWDGRQWVIQQSDGTTRPLPQ